MDESGLPFLTMQRGGEALECRKAGPGRWPRRQPAPLRGNASLTPRAHCLFTISLPGFIQSTAKWHKWLVNDSR